MKIWIEMTPNTLTSIFLYFIRWWWARKNMHKERYKIQHSIVWFCSSLRIRIGRYTNGKRKVYTVFRLGFIHQPLVTFDECVGGRLMATSTPYLLFRWHRPVSSNEIFFLRTSSSRGGSRVEHEFCAGLSEWQVIVVNNYREGYWNRFRSSLNYWNVRYN